MTTCPACGALIVRAQNPDGQHAAYEPDPRGAYAVLRRNQGSRWFSCAYPSDSGRYSPHICAGPVGRQLELA